MTIQDGFYKCRATGNAGFGIAGTGTEQMAVEVAILNEDETLTLTVLSAYLPFTAESADLSAKRLRALGLVGDDLTIDPLPGIGSIVAQCEVRTEVYQGQERQKVEIKTGGAQFKNPMRPDQRRAFAATLKNLLKGIPAFPGAVAGPISPPANRPAASTQQTQAQPPAASSNGFPPRGQQQAQQQDGPPPGRFPDDDIPF